MKKVAILFVFSGAALGFGAGYWVGERQRAVEGAAAGEEKGLIGRAQGARVEVAAAGAAAGAAAAAGAVVPAGEASFKEKSDFLKTMAAKDPQGAIAWAKANSGENERDDLYASIAKEWSKRDPEAAFAWAQTLSLAREREDAIRGVIEGTLESGNEAAAMAFIEALPPGEYQDTAMVAAVKHLASRDMERALGLVASMGETYAMRNAGRAIAAAMLESGGFAEARRRIEELPYGSLRSQLAMGMAEELAKKDVQKAMAWIAEASEGPDGDGLFDKNSMRSLSYSLARAMASQGDPADAIAWAGAIEDERTRMYFIEKLGEAWAQRSPEQASAWMTEEIQRQGFKGLEKLASGIFEEWIELDQNAPFEMIAGIADPEDRTRAAFMALNELADENPRIAAERMAQWVSADPEKAAKLSGRIMMQWLRRDPEQASTWLSEQRPGGIRDAGIEQLVRSVLREDHDIVTARAWAGEVSDSAIRERLGQEVSKYEQRGTGASDVETRVLIENGNLIRIQDRMIIRATAQ